MVYGGAEVVVERVPEGDPDARLTEAERREVIDDLMSRAKSNYACHVDKKGTSRYEIPLSLCTVVLLRANDINAQPTVGVVEHFGPNTGFPEIKDLPYGGVRIIYSGSVSGVEKVLLESIDPPRNPEVYPGWRQRYADGIQQGPLPGYQGRQEVRVLREGTAITKKDGEQYDAWLKHAQGEMQQRTNGR